MRRAIPALLLIVFCLPVAAAEGMWQPHQLPDLTDELRGLGLQLDPESMTRLTEHPMGAVISLGGCSASFVSPDGLVVTNHHCAKGSLQYNSSEENNLIQNGFLAEKRADEVPASPGSRVFVTVEVNDVTKQISGGIPAKVGAVERYEAIEKNEKRLVAKCEKDPGHRCGVYSFHGGLQYFLIKRMEILDVRLVYAPPGSIGVFGGDIDNWMWPRHTGDFSFYRAYVGPDGQPAEFAEDNVPFRPRHYLEVSPSGIGEDDYVMVIGYPGRTGRYRLASEVEHQFAWSYPTMRELLGGYLDEIERTTSDRPAAALKYASTVAGLNNATKNFDGMMDGFARGGMLERKLEQEQELRNWIAASPQRRERYAPAIEELDALIARDQATDERDTVLRYMGRSSMLSTARRLYRLSRERQKADADREPGYQERDMRSMGQRLTRLDRRFDATVDAAIWSYFIEQYRELPDEQRSAAFDEFMNLDKGDEAFAAKLASMYANTELDDQEKRRAWMEADRESIEASQDPFLQLAVAVYDDDMDREQEAKAIRGEYDRLRPLFMEAMIAYQSSQGKPVYADANGTLRVTYGTVVGYSPRDGMLYTPFTRLEGILEKYTGEDPFDSPADQLQAIKAGKHGRYSMQGLGSVPVNFLSTVDTTGGNSGSPTLNGRGQLVGLLFDGTYDSINADWDFNEETTRSIHVDVRYMLWVMQYIDGAHNLLREMGIPVADGAEAAVSSP